eukprot:TRINITY_DN9437_c0_g1_i2.p1 TRINITY_DN9437_c0_g1~~TRINITY_DN9437_c0_g1_i2.p1  ORF type:complete len:660 (-),score=188.18 TRINITY_DN9437_c0_g1_i2:151-2130(-)
MDKQNLEQPLPDAAMDYANKDRNNPYPNIDPMDVIEADTLRRKRTVGQNDIAPTKELQPEVIDSRVAVEPVLEQPIAVPASNQRQQDEIPMKESTGPLNPKSVFSKEFFEERKVAVAVDNEEAEHVDADALAARAHEREFARDDEDPLDAVDSDVIKQRMPDGPSQSKILLQKPNAKVYSDTGDLKLGDAVPVRAAVEAKREDSDEDPLDAVHEDVLNSKMLGDSPDARRGLQGAKTETFPANVVHDPILEKGKTTTKKKDKDHLEDLIEPEVLNKNRDAPVLDNKNSAKPLNAHKGMEETKSTKPVKEEIGVVPILVKDKTAQKEDSNLDDPLNAVDPQVLNKEVPDDLVKGKTTAAVAEKPALKATKTKEPTVSRALPREDLYAVPIPLAERAEAKKENDDDDDDEPLDAVDPKVLSSKMPKDQLVKSKTHQVGEAQLRDNVLVREKTKVAPVPTGLPKREVDDGGRDFAAAASKNAGAGKELGGVAVIPFPGAAEEQNADRSPMDEDPLDAVDPRVLTGKMPERDQSPGSKNRLAQDLKHNPEDPITNKSKASPFDNAYERAGSKKRDSSPLKFGNNSELSDEPLDAVDAKVFDKSPGSKRTPLEILLSLGYDVSKHKLDDVVEIDPPAKSLEQLGNVRISQINFGAKSSRMIEAN